NRLGCPCKLEGVQPVLPSLIHLFTLFRYHEWMKRPEFQHLTASDWREDDDKCTFIVLDKQQWADPSIEEEQCMVGDVNMFLTDPTDLSSAELEIMVTGDAQCAYLKSDSKSKAEKISTVSLCCGLYISIISCVNLFISGHYIPLVFYRAHLQRQGH
uniref:Uncharacterized protein n=1 Tax=Monopterus albus TaxID=43700 RepID=A0A3Q3K5D8_MONAL